MKKIIFLFLFCFVVFFSCKKDDEENNNSILNSFTSLTVENDTILTGQSTKITAVTDGKDIAFSWSATAGDILGSGSKVTYVAPTCTPGKNEVTCTASASNKTESKSIYIVVF